MPRTPDPNKMSPESPWVVLPDGTVVSKYDDRGNLNIMWNDQVSTPVENFLSNEINAITIENTLALGDNTFTLTAGHGCIVGNYLEFSYYDEVTDPDNPVSRGFQSEIGSVVTNTIRTSLPVGFAVNPTYVYDSKRTTVNMAVVGDIDACKRFSSAPTVGVKWDITGMTVDMLCPTPIQPDDSLFGNIPKLAWGVYFGLEKFSGAAALYGLNYRDNTDFNASGFGLKYAERSVPTGSWGVQGHKYLAGPPNWGVVIRADEVTDDELLACVQDNISAITQMRLKIFGHQVI